MNTFDKTERILAIDYGEKRIGIAITDPLKIFAYPLKTLLNNKNFWNNFDKIFQEFNIRKIIIGNPLNEKGEESGFSEKVRNFKNELRKRLDLEVVLVDERYTSKIAKQNLLESVKSKKKRRDKSLIDKNAAAVLLQDFLDSA